MLKGLKDDIDEKIDSWVENDQSVRDVVNYKEPFGPVCQNLKQTRSIFGSC